MVNFRKALTERLMAKLVEWNLGIGTIDKRLRALTDTELTPFVVVYVRQISKLQSEEMPSTGSLKTWEVHLYYLDKASDYNTGEERQENIAAAIVEKLEADATISNLQATDGGVNRIYAYDSQVTSVLFDSSGQEGDYSFVSEIYFNVSTDG